MKITGVILGFCLILTGCGKSDGTKELKFVLGLDELPASIKNIQFGEDAWTDYILHIYCELDPQDFDKIISSKPFKKTERLNPQISFKTDPPEYASSIPTFSATEIYYWSGGDLNDATLKTTDEHDRIYVIYGAD